MLPETRSRWKGNHAAVLSLSGDLEVGLGALILPLNLAGFGPGGRWEWIKEKEEKGKGGRITSCWPSLWSLQTQVATKRQKVISEFAYLSQFLEEQQSILLAQLDRLDGDILKQRDEFDVLVTGEICRFSSLITELEEKNERPARELLTVRPVPVHLASDFFFFFFLDFTMSKPCLLHSYTSLHPQWKMGHRTRSSEF